MQAQTRVATCLDALTVGQVVRLPAARDCLACAHQREGLCGRRTEQGADVHSAVQAVLSKDKRVSSD